MTFCLSKNQRLHVRLVNFDLPGECGISFIWSIGDVNRYIISKTILCFIVANFANENSKLSVSLYHFGNKEDEYIYDYETEIRGEKSIFDFCNKLIIEDNKICI